MIKNLIAIIIGILVLNLVGVSGIVPQSVLPFIANFTGGFITGLITRKNGFTYGAIVSIVSFLFLILSLIYTSYQASGGSLFFPEMTLLFPNLFALMLGPIGGYFGEKIRK
jgi:hypothetical protein